VTRTQAELGEHNQAILTELGYSPADIQAFIQQKVI
ncbi:MAG: hypothetical protein RL657_2404, partial [Pseudomonadota bacterium]